MINNIATFNSQTCTYVYKKDCYILTSVKFCNSTSVLWGNKNIRGRYIYKCTISMTILRKH